ncbi:YhgN family NAAT transporter [Candidatus Blochmannia ocreatus (nom. nud.)]|uniref:UPF0056 membrane protein n=1 Tax=Candidatus Blochmannia ocreatus (nom. nud.) TaxID=251538 RepID=A0ABY4SVM4_9ENTR|nr:YhgN family NAAT transporter [Candidatus Blochmannia ocreatus]URJ25050.1 YhgN family NAAT transporter [Candidatus Blochmannia ocreatus]
MNEMISATILLFLIMDPIGNLPIFMSILKDLDPKRRQIIIIREMIIALLLMLGFLFVGEYILKFLNLHTETVSISGGIVLFLIAIRMLFPSDEGNNTGCSPGEEPFLVPLAIPLVAGPSVLATLLLLSHQYPQEIKLLILALVVAWGLSMLVLMLSNVLSQLLGVKGISALERLMGLLLVMISTQMLLDGVHSYFNL